MHIKHRKQLICKLLVLGVLITTLVVLNLFRPRSIGAQTLTNCADDVLNYCWSQSPARNVDPYSCQCDPNSCVGIPASDCQERGMYLSYSDCQCHENPSYISVCDNDPYALGCPRSFDTVFGNLLRSSGSPYYGGGDGDICSFSAFAWCANNGGSWYSPGCACSFYPSSSPSDECASAGGTWVNNGNAAGGGVCYNPSGYGAESQCGSSSATLSSCVQSNGRWNPYTCTCSP